MSLLGLSAAATHTGACPMGGCHHIRAISHKNGYPHRPRVAISYFFTSHDNIHHSSCARPPLLFSDPRVVCLVDVQQFQGQAVHRLNQQHIQLELRKGMTVLVHYRVQEGAHVNELFQAVLIAQVVACAGAVF